MKNKFAGALTVIILVFFAGAVFLYGEKNINSPESNKFTVFHFENKNDSFGIDSADFSAFAFVVSNKQKNAGTVKLSYFVNGSMLAFQERMLSAKDQSLLPPDEFFSALRQMQTNDSFEYKIVFKQEGKEKDHIKKKILIQ